MQPKVSIIIPAYNVENYITDTLDSVKNQTYEDWECIIADDCSADHTRERIMEYCNQDMRFRYLRLECNCGAAAARNRAIDGAKGQYLAFLDSDDLWDRDKLRKQLAFMEENKYTFTCTSYGKVDAQGNVKNRIVGVKRVYDYDEILRNCPGNSTIIYDCSKLGKIYGENIKRRNDFVMWLKVIKVAHYAYGLDEVLTYHREREASLSSNKEMLLKYQWKVYREIERLPLCKCGYLMAYKIGKGLQAKMKTLWG